MIKNIEHFGTLARLAPVKRLKSWMSDTDGAITVDWVVLTATMTVIGGIIVTMTVDGTTDVGNQIGTVLKDKPVK